VRAWLRGTRAAPQAGRAPDALAPGPARSWQALRFPNSLLAAVAACKEGVRRAHLVDARVDGGLLLELYSRDGMGTMISTDFYECAPALMRLLAGAGGRGKARLARAQGHPAGGDLRAIEQLLAPLEREGVTRKRSRSELAASLPDFTVVERESKARHHLPR